MCLRQLLIKLDTCVRVPTNEQTFARSYTTKFVGVEKAIFFMAAPLLSVWDAGALGLNPWSLKNM